MPKSPAVDASKDPPLPPPSFVNSEEATDGNTPPHGDGQHVPTDMHPPDGHAQHPTDAGLNAPRVTTPEATAHGEEGKEKKKGKKKKGGHRWPTGHKSGSKNKATTAAKPTAEETAALEARAYEAGVKAAARILDNSPGYELTEINGHEEPTDNGFFWNAVWADGSDTLEPTASFELWTTAAGDHVMLDAFVHYVDTMGINTGRWIRRSDVEDSGSEEEEEVTFKKGAKNPSPPASPATAANTTATHPDSRAEPPSSPLSPGTRFEDDDGVTMPRPADWTLVKNAHTLVHYVPDDDRDDEWTAAGRILEYKLGKHGGPHLFRVALEDTDDTKWLGEDVLKKPTATRAETGMQTNSPSLSPTSLADAARQRTPHPDSHTTSPSSQSFSRVEDGEPRAEGDDLATSLASFDLDDDDDTQPETQLRRAALVQQAKLLAACNADQRRRALQPNATTRKKPTAAKPATPAEDEAEDFRNVLQGIVDSAKKNQRPHALNLKTTKSGTTKRDRSTSPTEQDTQQRKETFLHDARRRLPEGDEYDLTQPYPEAWMFAPDAQGICRNRPVTIIEIRVGIGGAEHQVRTVDDTKASLTRWNDIDHVHRRMPTRQRRDVPRLDYHENSNSDEDEDDSNDGNTNYNDSNGHDAQPASAFNVGDTVLASDGRKPSITRRGTVEQRHINANDPRDATNSEGTYIYIVRLENKTVGAFQAHQLTLQEHTPKYNAPRRQEPEPRADTPQRTSNRRSTRKPTTMPTTLQHTIGRTTLRPLAVRKGDRLWDTASEDHVIITEFDNTGGGQGKQFVKVEFERGGTNWIRPTRLVAEQRPVQPPTPTSKCRYCHKAMTTAEPDPLCTKCEEHLYGKPMALPTSQCRYCKITLHTDEQDPLCDRCEEHHRTTDQRQPTNHVMMHTTSTPHGNQFGTTAPSMPQHHLQTPTPLYTSGISKQLPTSQGMDFAPTTAPMHIPRAPNRLSEELFEKERFQAVVLTKKFTYESTPIQVYLTSIAKQSQLLNNYRVSQSRLMIDCIKNLNDGLRDRMLNLDALNFDMAQFERMLTQMCPKHLLLEPQVHRANMERNRCKDARALPQHMVKIETAYLALATRTAGDPVPLTLSEYIRTVGHHVDHFGNTFASNLIHQIRDGIQRTIPFDLRVNLFALNDQIFSDVNTLPALQRMYQLLNELVESTLPIHSTAPSLWGTTTVHDEPVDGAPTLLGGAPKPPKSAATLAKDAEFKLYQAKRNDHIKQKKGPSELNGNECLHCVDQCSLPGKKACNCPDFNHYHSNCPHATDAADRKKMKCKNCDKNGHTTGSIQCPERRGDRKKAVPGKRLQ